MDKPVRTLLFLKQPPQACVCNLNESAEPMHMNHPAQAFFSPHILTIYVFGRYKHDSKLYAKLLICLRQTTICGLLSEYYTSTNINY